MKRIVCMCFLAALSTVVHADDLYKQSAYSPMFSDKKAFRPGEVLTVLIEENASAIATADTTTDKKGSLSVGAKTAVIDRMAALDGAEDFSGQGRIRRTGKLLAQLSVIVQSVDEQGLLIVHGQQEIEVNGEKQEIELSGKVRPSDIQDNNTISSTRVAEARMRYVGDGILAEKQRPGVLTRLLSWLRLL